MLAELADPAAVVTLAGFVIGLVVSSWLSLRKLTTREQHRTNRLVEALKDARPQERPAIIRALSSLEGGEENEVTPVGVPSESCPTTSANRMALASIQRFLRKIGSERGN